MCGRLFVQCLAVTLIKHTQLSKLFGNANNKHRTWHIPVHRYSFHVIHTFLFANPVYQLHVYGIHVNPHEAFLWTDSRFLWGMMTSSNGNIFRVTGPLCGEFTGPAERPVMRRFEVFSDLRLNKRLSKHISMGLVIWDAIALIMTSLLWDTITHSKFCYGCGFISLFCLGVINCFTVHPVVILNASLRWYHMRVMAFRTHITGTSTACGVLWDMRQEHYWSWFKQIERCFMVDWKGSPV